jgi:hypothetical protein
MCLARDLLRQPVIGHLLPRRMQRRGSQAKLAAAEPLFVIAAER